MTTGGRERVALVMAGGRGQRFWPLSTEARPKQFLDLDRRGRTLLQATVDRVAPLVGGPERVVVATAARYEALVREQVPEVPPENLLLEPVGRDSGPAIALAALRIRARFGDALMATFASDHQVEDLDAFAATVERAMAVAEAYGGLVAIGVRPTRPSTAYGYLERGAPRDGGFALVRFTEKPTRERAERWVADGRHLWNAGMFVWTTDAILAALDAHAPDLMAPLRTAVAEDAVEARFADLPKISIDYAVMEKAEGNTLVEGDFGWDDVGDWRALERLLPRDDDEVRTVFGAHAGHDASGNIVYTDGPEDVLVAFGVEGLVIVKRGDTVLVFPKDRVGDIKELLEDERLRDLVP
ncbi:MAG: sugar phosphate nucleotidyltransferase [Trueperaceae bacterium]|nr:sugar phosphate nucleotidyltransferase [Trueperaceae bacterium]